MINKYRVRVWSNGRIRRSLDGQAHCDTGPAIQWLFGWKDWYTNGVWIKTDKGRNDK